jgi:hypothetical protein
MPINQTKLQRLESLIRLGYFPFELPPVFTTRNFSDNLFSIRRNWQKTLKDPKNLPKTRYYKFSIPKNTSARRSLALVNPVNQYAISELISSEWNEIKKYISSSSFSTFRADFDDQNAIPWEDFRFRHERNQKALSRSGSALVSDISRFYPTLYTHSVPWALHGKYFAKKNIHNHALLGNKIDKTLRKCQDEQSIGIPTGPITSRIIAEIVGTAIDKEIAKRFPYAQDGYIRHADDVLISIPPEMTVDQARNLWSQSLAVYELEINEQKTERILPGERVEPEWLSALRFVGVPARGQKDRHIDEYFTTAFSYSQRYPDQSVLSYAIKKAQSFIVLDNNWPIFEHYIKQAAWHDGRVVQHALQIIAQGAADGKPVDNAGIREFCYRLIRERLPSGHEHEAIWALFLLRALRSGIATKKDLAPVLEVEPTLCSLVALDMRQQHKASFTTPNAWTKIAKDCDLSSEDWLFVYEVAQKGWITDGLSKIKKHNFFAALLNRDVWFYDEKRNFRSTIRILRDRLAHLHHIDAAGDYDTPFG